jgi:hypothetical protein
MMLMAVVTRIVYDIVTLFPLSSASVALTRILKIVCTRELSPNISFSKNNSLEQLGIQPGLLKRVLFELQ